MNETPRHKGPWTHRVLIYAFSILFGILIYWLLGFVVNDIATWPGPNYRDLEKSMLDPKVTSGLETLQTQIDEANRSITSQRQRQTVLRDSTSNSERTMNQLLELQKLTLQKELKPSPEEVVTLADSQKLFLGNQAKYQEINAQIAQLNDALIDLQNQQRAAQKQLEELRKPVQEKYQKLEGQHRLKLAVLKLSFLIPMLAVAVWLFTKKRGSLYALPIYGFGLALLAKTGMVMHEHFPKRYFKYVLIGVAILLVIRILVYLLRMLAFPKVDWLLKQYRESYEHFMCPICSHPIRRGPLKHLFWTRRSLKKLRVAAEPGNAPDEPYTCPVCTTRLFEECPSCHGIRHSLLPACARCGAAKNLQTPATP
jgi:hypothetical protein